MPPSSTRVPGTFGGTTDSRRPPSRLLASNTATLRLSLLPFSQAKALRPETLNTLLTTIITRVTRTLVRAGVLVAEAGQPYLDLEMDSPYEQRAGAAIRYVIAAGPQAGRATMRLHDPLLAVEPSGARTKPLTTARDGFSLNCAVACEAHERAKLERVCRYMARGPIAQDHLSVDGDGLVVLELKRAFSDGTTHVLFEPQDFTAPAPPCARLVRPCTSSRDWRRWCRAPRLIW